jgi:hypothetical protein
MAHKDVVCIIGHYGIVGPLNQFVHLWGYESRADYETRIRERDRDPDWPAYLAASAQLITAQETRLLNCIELQSMQGFRGTAAC